MQTGINVDIRAGKGGHGGGRFETTGTYGSGWLWQSGLTGHIASFGRRMEKRGDRLVSPFNSMACLWCTCFNLSLYLYKLWGPNLSMVF